MGLFQLFRNGASKEDTISPATTDLSDFLMALVSTKEARRLHSAEISPRESEPARQAASSRRLTRSLEELILPAESESTLLCHGFPGTEHMPLALVQHGRNSLPRHLQNQGMDPGFTRRETFQVLVPEYQAAESCVRS